MHLSFRELNSLVTLRKNLCWLLRTVVGPGCALVTICSKESGCYKWYQSNAIACWGDPKAVKPNIRSPQASSGGGFWGWIGIRSDPEFVRPNIWSFQQSVSKLGQPIGRCGQICGVLKCNEGVAVLKWGCM